MSDKIEVYKAIATVAQELSKAGISKDQSNKQQGYKFRGIDDVYNSLAPILSKNNLVIIPRVLSREVTERTTAKGSILFYVVVEAEFDFISAVDGSIHTAKTYGEAMDSGDKATNKAMSAAYKYVCFQAFCIPTQGDNDADFTTHHEIAAPPQKTSADYEPIVDKFISIASLNGWVTEKDGELKKVLSKSEYNKIVKYVKDTRVLIAEATRKESEDVPMFQRESDEINAN